MLQQLAGYAGLAAFVALIVVLAIASAKADARRRERDHLVGADGDADLTSRGWTRTRSVGRIEDRLFGRAFDPNSGLVMGTASNEPVYVRDGWATFRFWYDDYSVDTATPQGMVVLVTPRRLPAGPDAWVTVYREFSLSVYNRAWQEPRRRPPWPYGQRYKPWSQGFAPDLADELQRLIVANPYHPNIIVSGGYLYLWTQQMAVPPEWRYLTREMEASLMPLADEVIRRIMR